MWSSCCGESIQRSFGVAPAAGVMPLDRLVVPQQDEADLGDENLSLLAREMNQLSVKQREGVYEEIHGIVRGPVESPEMIAQNLSNLRQVLNKLSRRPRRAYDMALFLRPALDTDDNFQLMFLRANGFNINLAVQMICRHFEVKLELFGPEKLAKDISITDMTEEDLVEFRSGSLLLLGKDRSGRDILSCDLRFVLGKNWMGFQRFVWYIHMDAAIRGNGLVSAAYLLNLDESATEVAHAVIAMAPKIVNTIPCGDRGVHLAYDIPNMRPLLSMAHLALGTERRLRFRAHFGSPLEVRYSLLSFGIVSDCFIHLGSHNQFAAVGLAKEYIDESRQRDEARERSLREAETNSGLIVLPRPEDCLIGRGKCYQDYCGNVRFAHLIEEYRDRYGQCTQRLDKTVVAMEVTDRVKEYGGRFLLRVDGIGWQSANTETILQKVAQALRFRVRTNAEQQKLLNNKAEEQKMMVGKEAFVPTNASESLPDTKRMKLTLLG